MNNKDHLLEIHFRKKAESGDRFSMHKLGSILEARGAVDSKTGAEYWYRRATELGSEVGQNKLNELLARNSVVSTDFHKTSVDSELLATNNSSPNQVDIKRQETKSIDLNSVYGLNSFSFENQDLVRATKGLALIVDDEYWIIQDCTYASVVASSKGVARSYLLGECFLTEGKRFGPLVPPKSGDPTDLSILLEDRIRKICTDFVGDDQVVRDPVSLEAIRKISLRIDNDFETIRNDLKHLETAAEIASAVMGVITVGADNCGYPTNSFQLSRFFATKKLDWLGIDWPMSLISDWDKNSLSFVQARELVNMGVDVKKVQEWVDFKKSSLRGRDLTFDDIKSWIVVGLSPALCMEFSDFGVNPTNALVALAHSVSPVRAGLWLEYGIFPSLIDEWESFSFSPAIAWEWTKLGCSPSTAFEWGSHSFGPDVFLLWGGVTVNVELVQLCIDNQITPETLQNWLFFQSLVSSEREIIEWIKSGISPDEAKRWTHFGVTVEIAKSWHLGLGASSEHLSYDMVQWARSGFLFESASNWIRHGIQIEDAIHARACSFSVDDYVSWRKWSFHPQQNFKQIVAWSMSNFTPIEVQNWLAAGVQSIEKAEQIRAAGFSGATMAIYVANLQRASLTKKLDAREQSGHNSQKLNQANWIKENAQLATTVWLMEIIDRAEYLRPKLRKSLDRRVTLELVDNIFLSVEMNSNNVAGILSGGQISFSVEFDIDLLEITPSIKSPVERLTFGLALSWFIDLSISLRGGQTSSSNCFARARNANSSNLGVRYVPTWQLDSVNGRIRNGEGVAKVKHSVAGHIRRLPNGRYGSEEARERAPKYLRSQIGSDETYVRPHQRGELEAYVDYENRLSKFSACAHALIELKA